MDESAKEHVSTNVTNEDLRHKPCSNQNEESLVLEDENEKKIIRKNSLRNMAVFCVSYILCYTGFWALTNLQSTMNAAEGIGNYSQAVIYIFSTISSLFLPTMLIQKFGCKNVLVMGTLLCAFSIASNMYLRWDLMMTASVCFGLANGPFIAAQCYYIDEMATRFQSTITENIEFIMSLFFGIALFSTESTQMLGNAISYFILSDGKSPPVNITQPSECGVRFISFANDTNENLDPPSDYQRHLLVGIYLGLALLSALVLAVFLDSLKNDLKEGSSWTVMLERFSSALKHLRKPHQVLLLPLSVYMGMEGPFYGYEITQAYIGCSWGVEHVGFVSICYGVCGAVISLLVGPLVKYTSQMAVFFLAAIGNASICITLFLWEPSPDSKTIYFVIAGVWGMGDAIWWSQVSALYGLMFPNDREAAFSNLFFWSFLGFFLSYSYAKYFTVPVKISIMLGFLLIGMIGYMIGQLKIKCTSRK